MSATVLVVDDEPDVRTLCKVNLQFEGFEVEEAPDGETALEMISEAPPDLILLDLMMPGLDGWEVMERLKEDEKTASIPVILLTAKADEDSQLRGWEEGVLDYITKPFNPLSLTKIVESALETRDTEAEERRRSVIVEQLRKMKDMRTR